MDVRSENHGFHHRNPRPFYNAPTPYTNTPMFPQSGPPFSQRGAPFRPPRMRGMPRRGGPPGRMMRPGFRPERPHIRPPQSGHCHPYMMNRPMFFEQQGNSYEGEFDPMKKVYSGNHNSENIQDYGHSGNLEEGSMPKGTDNSSQEIIFACDSCDRNFPSETIFNKHMSEHKVCGLDGCTFSAHFKIIEKHIEMQHSTGIFERMKNLDSPENIAKWIEERKARFPSKENIEKRHKQQEELWKKGIRIGERKNKLGRGTNKFTPKDPQTRRKERDDFFKKKEEKRDRLLKKYQPKLLIDEKSDWNGNLPPFRGLIELFGSKDEEKFTISDDEDDYTKKPTKIEDIVQVNSSLGALMGYGSDYSEDDEEPPINVKKEEENSSVKEVASAADKKEDMTDKKIDSDDEGPLEVKTVKATIQTEVKTNSTEPNNNKPKESTEKTNKRKRKNKNKDQKSQKIIKTQHNPHQFRTRKISHLEKILDEDIRRERNIILQCVRFTVENNFFMKSQ